MNLQQIRAIEKAFEPLELKFYNAEIDDFLGGKLVYEFEILGDLVGLKQLNEMAKSVPENYYIIIDFSRQKILIIND